MMTYRILLTKTLDVPKNVLHGMYETEELAMEAAKAKLMELDADVAVVMRVTAGMTRVIQRFEKVSK
jgi:hypothetical protein